MFNSHIKFELSAITFYEDMKGNAKCRLTSSSADQPARRAALTANGKIFKQSRDNNHAHLGDDISSFW